MRAGFEKEDPWEVRSPTPLEWEIQPSEKWDAPKTMEDFQALAKQHKLNTESYRPRDLEALVALGSQLIFDEYAAIPDLLKPNLEWLYKAAPLLLSSNEDLFPAAMRFLRLVDKEGRSNIKKKLEEGKMEELEELLEELEEEERKTPGGKKGGEDDFRPSKGNWYGLITRKKKLTLPNLGMTDVLTRAKALDGVYKIGSPKEKSKKTFLRKMSHFEYLTEETLSLDDNSFYQAYAEEKLEISLPLKSIKTKQKVFVLLDCSGSMGSDNKTMQTVHILDAMLEQVLEGNTIIYFSYFVRDRKDFIKIETSDEVDNFKENIFQNPNGGDTYLGPILQTLNRGILTGNVDGFEVDPTTEIVVINDGQDDVTPVSSNIPIHAFMLNERNDGLEEVVKNSKGQAYYVDYRGAFQLL